MDFQEKLHSFEDYEDDDDVFYDQLRRQILQLTVEDEDVVGDGNVHESKIMLQPPKQGPCRGVPHPVPYHGWPGINEDCAATPAWMVNLWRTGNGTGVFIPQGVQSRRRNRSRRKNDKGRANKQFVKMN